MITICVSHKPPTYPAFAAFKIAVPLLAASKIAVFGGNVQLT
jgi:hypothetical protein